MTSKLLERTRVLLSTTMIPLTRIARELGCNPKTLYSIRDGENDPGVTLCESIYNFLSRDPLEVK
jgi:DNA-binding XRE family transcriptional regulator